MPDFGVGEGAALFGGGLGDLLASFFGGGEAAAAGAGAGAAEAGTAAAGATSLADLVGTGTGLAGGATGLEGTLLAGGATGGVDAALGAGGATALETAGAFLGAPAASAFTPSAVGGASLLGDAGAAGGTSAFDALGGSAGLSSNVANANAGASVFDTGTSGIAGTTASGAPSAVPAGAGAAATAAPAGVTAPVDATAAAPGAAGGASGAAGGSSSSISDLLSKAGSGAMKSLTSNPLGIALGAGGLGYSILEGQKNTANQKALAADAQTATANSNQMVASGEALQQYLTNGTLPPNYQTQVDQAINDAKTKAISNAAAQGLPTDPTKNTALAQELDGIENSKASMQTQVASQLFSSGQGLVNSGATAAGLSGQLYQSLVANDTASAANTGKAIATLAAALNNKTNTNIGGTNIQLSAA